MKKIVLALSLLTTIIMFGTSFAYASNTDNVLDNEMTSQLVEIKEKSQKELEDYKQAYGNDAYGFTAYMLAKIRIYSIPLCFIGIAVGAIWQYVIGIRKLDVHDRGLFLIVSFVTIFVICQVLPLIFAIVVKGWRG